MSIRYLAVVLAAILPTVSLAQTPQQYHCTYGDLQRRIEIVYETGVTVPCEVHYYKDTEAPDAHMVLWRALNQEGFCEAKTQEFVNQLEEWGWACDAATVPAPAAEPEPAAEPAGADDTAALEPAEPEESPDQQ